ncbi:MAG: transposase [Acidimicrobiales bacterium]|nr:transposase [Acidimicrobiales bacterium]
MADSYLTVDRGQQFLLPPDMRDWLDPDHLVFFLLDVLESLDLSVLHRGRVGGVGRRGYDPEVLLAVLLYGYCSGVRSSRKLELLCGVDVAFRVIAGGYLPDHTTIARFRNEHGCDAEEVFVRVLELCAAAGLVDVGVVAIDGTKMAGDASINRNRTREWVEKAFAEAEEVDAAEDVEYGEGRGDELPAEWRAGEGRKDRIRAVLEEMDERRRVEQEAMESDDAAWVERVERAGANGKLPTGKRPRYREVEAARESLDAALKERAEMMAARQARIDGGERIRGAAPKEEGTAVRVRRKRLADAIERAETHAAKAGKELKANLTDPQSRVMPTKGKGWVQGYNAQAAVTEDGFVVAAEVFNVPGDVDLAEPMMAQTVTNSAAARAGDVGTVLFDAGYFSEANITMPGPKRLIAFAKSHRMKKTDPTIGPPPAGVSPVEAMRHEMRTPEGAETYAKRQHVVEPVFGDWKHLRNFRRFSLRSLEKVNAEWRLQATAHNIAKAHRIGMAI